MTDKPIRIANVRLAYNGLRRPDGPEQPGTFTLTLDRDALAQRAQMRAAERQGTRIATRFAKPKSPWEKKR